MRLPREERAEVVASLRESGLSLRAIASATGQSYGTIQAEVIKNDHLTVEPEPVSPEVVDPETGAAQCIHCGDTLPLSKLYEGGQGYECDPCVSPDEAGVPEQELPPLPENYMGGTPDDGPTKSGSAATNKAAPPSATVTGVDGKTYPAKPTAPSRESKRKPITATARNLDPDLEKLTRRLEELAADDRLARNKNEVAPRLRYHLEQLVKVCQDLNSQLTEGV